jgi:hypothetical protein
MTTLFRIALQAWHKPGKKIGDQGTSELRANEMGVSRSNTWKGVG